MRSPSKKRARLTSLQFKQQKQKLSISHEPKHGSTTSAEYNPSPICCNPSLLCLNSSSPISSVYKIPPPSDGIDLFTFRRDLLSNYTPKLNITSIINKSISHKIVELDSSSSNSPSANSNHIQPKISSFLQFKANSIQQSSLSLLYNTSRCVVEDFMLLEKHQSVLILVPKSKKYQPTQFKRIQKILPSFSLIQFSSSQRSAKYYLAEATVISYP